MTQLDFSDYAEQPAARGGDPVTSKMAALLGGRSVHKALVCRALYEHGPLHDEKIAKVIDRPKSATIKRRGDLVTMGLVTQATMHGEPVFTTTDAGARTIVWMLTTAGHQAARALPSLAPPPRVVSVPTTTLSSILGDLRAGDLDVAIKRLENLIP